MSLDRFAPLPRAAPSHPQTRCASVERAYFSNLRDRLAQLGCYSRLQRHVARRAADARPVKTHIDNSRVNAHNLDVAAIRLNIRSDQVDNGANAREQGIFVLPRLR